MAFKKNKKSKEGFEKSDIAKKYGFRISTPNGYFPEDVDSIIEKLENQLSLLEKETINLEKQLEQTLEDKRLAEKELTRLKFDISLMEVPDTSANEDFSMLSRLENINSDVGGMPQDIPEIVEKDSPTLEVIEEEKTKDVFDELVSTKNNIIKKQKAKPKVRHSANIFNEDGTLDIL